MNHVIHASVSDVSTSQHRPPERWRLPVSSELSTNSTVSQLSYDHREEF